MNRPFLEGNSKKSKKERCKFCDINRGGICVKRWITRKQLSLQMQTVQRRLPDKYRKKRAE
jgi:hypothetical protein